MFIEFDGLFRILQKTTLKVRGAKKLGLNWNKLEIRPKWITLKQSGDTPIVRKIIKSEYFVIV